MNGTAAANTTSSSSSIAGLFCIRDFPFCEKPRERERGISPSAREHVQYASEGGRLVSARGGTTPRDCILSSAPCDDEREIAGQM